MAMRRALAGVAHNAAESFPNHANWAHEDTALGHIVLMSWRTQATRIVVDLLTGKVESSKLATWSTVDSLTRLVSEFPAFVADAGSDVSVIAVARLIVEVEPSQRRPNSGYIESPYTCTVQLVDDRGHTYEHARSGWFFPQASFRPGADIEQALQPDCGAGEASSTSKA